MVTTCTSCGHAYIAGQPCPARGDGAHTRRRPALPRAEAHSEAVRVRFTPGELRALDRLAARLRVSRAEAVRRAVGDAFAQRAELLAEVKRLRALPVLPTCGDCGWQTSALSKTRAVIHVCRKSKSREIDLSAAPPSWCPLRGGER